MSNFANLIFYMKKFGFIILCVLVFISCGKYNEVLKGNSTEDKFNLAKEFYETSKENGKRGKMLKALRLLEQIQPSMRGKPQNEIVSYMIANGNYIIGDYIVSGYKFERFLKSFPDTPKKEEAFYKSADSYYKASPKFSLDQTDTFKAIDKLQIYLNTFSDGEYFEEANSHLAELREKLERKDYEIAKQFHHMEFWQPAVHALNNFVDNNPGSNYLEPAYFYKFESQKIYAEKSFKSIMRERLDEATEYYNTYIERYPEGEYLKKANQLYAEMQLLYNELNELEL
ncbi:outer membrane protein assembly factor BamD [Psychroflexus salis]|uniref:Outer membrane protein assembly factor BamD n=2 Tax=Psychroflexus salis TaxID=1526574 RepID=A0A916ZWC0_9FLAO|nr:outer membrane protein assembly factor BamD [Psychroflexus salis]